MQSINGHINDLGFKTSAASANLGSLGTIMGSLANPMTLVAGAAAAAGAALAGSVQAAAAWESGMAGVAKTTGLAGPELQALSKELLTMSTNMPTAAADLQSIAGVAGSLGVAKENIAGFTEVAAQMSVGFEMSAESAATSAAKILTAYGQEINTENMRALGNVVNSMGDNFAATEPQVLDFVNRASFLNTTMGQTIPQIAALGTVLISTGMDADVAATGLKSFLNMATSETSKTGGMDNWAKLMGTDVASLNEMLQSDFNGTLIETANQIAAIEDPVKRFQTAVALAGTEGAPALLKLAGQGENLAKALGLTNSEWENGQSLMKTYEAQSSTLNSQWQIFSNTINMAAVEFGSTLLPALSSGLSTLNDIAKVGIKVGETLYSMGESFINSEFGQLMISGLENSLPGQLLSLTGDAVGSAWGATKDWAGIGTEHAEQMAKEISENEKLQKAGAEALETDEAKAALAQAGTSGGEEYAKAFADSQKAWLDANSAAYQAGYGQVNGQLVNWTAGKSSSETDKIQDQNVKLGEQEYILRRIGENQAANFQLLDAQNNVIAETGKIYNERLSNFSPLTWATDVAPKGNLWESWGSAMNEEKWFADNEEMVENSGKQLGFALYTGMGVAIQSGDEQLKQSMEIVLKGIADPGSIPSEVFNLALADIIDADLISPEWKTDIQTAATDAVSQDFVLDKEGALKLKFESLGEEVSQAMGDKIIDVTEQETLVALAEEYTKMGGDASEALIQAIQAKDWAEVGRLIGSETGEGYKTGLFGALQSGAEGKSLAELLADPAELQKAVTNWQTWSENTFQPQLKSDMESMNKLYQTGYSQDVKTVEEYLGKLQTIHEEHSTWFDSWQNELLNMYDAGKVSLEALLDIWDQMENASTKADSANEKIKDQTVGYNNLQKAIEDCSECAISEFGTWQESQDGLFQDSYIGQGGMDYYAWKLQQIQEIAATQEAMKAVGGAVVGQDYTNSELLQQTIKFDADMTSAETSKATFEADVKATSPEMTLQIETTAAMNEINQLVNYIITVNPVMSVQVSVSAYADEIVAIVTGAVRDALA